jgi:hypothetical protein
VWASIVIEDPYSVLGVSRRASAATVRRAFKRLALLHHPDRNPEAPDAADRFRRVCDAYKLITSPRPTPVQSPSNPSPPPRPSSRRPAGVSASFTDWTDEYPTPEEIAALDLPTFRPLKTLAWICAALVLLLLISSLILESLGVKPEPPDPMFQKQLKHMGRPY